MAKISDLANSSHSYDYWPYSGLQIGTGINSAYITITNSYSQDTMTSTTIRVTNNESAKEFDGDKAEVQALEYARELAHSSNKTVYLQKVYKLVKPKREVTEEDVK